MTEQMPPDPFVNTDILPMAKGAHDLFVAFCNSGFSEPQALHMTVGIVSSMLNDALRNAPK